VQKNGLTLPNYWTDFLSPTTVRISATTIARNRSTSDVSGRIGTTKCVPASAAGYGAGARDLRASREGPLARSKRRPSADMEAFERTPLANCSEDVTLRTGHKNGWSEGMSLPVGRD
jgi:hypothetical protein